MVLGKKGEYCIITMVSFYVYDITFLVLFTIGVVFFLRTRKKDLSKEGWMFMYRTKFGVKAMTWFDDKFHKEVSSLIIHEKIDRRFMNHEQGGGTPDMENVRIGLHNLKIHLEYICYLLSQRDWLAGQELSLADITAAAHLSCLDYTGDIVWREWPDAREWYAKLKSRPSFRSLLSDHLAGLRPASHYTDLDF